MLGLLGRPINFVRQDGDGMGLLLGAYSSKGNILQRHVGDEQDIR